MKRILVYFLVLTLFLSACGNQKSAETTQPTIAEGFDLLGGTIWRVGRVGFDGTIVPITIDEGIFSLYDDMSLTFYEDGTYREVTFGTYITHGTYAPVTTVNDGVHRFILTADSTLGMGVDDDGEVRYRERPEDTNQKYMLIITQEREFVYGEYDPITQNLAAPGNASYYIPEEDFHDLLQ